MTKNLIALTQILKNLDVNNINDEEKLKINDYIIDICNNMLFHHDDDSELYLRSLIPIKEKLITNNGKEGLKILFRSYLYIIEKKIDPKKFDIIIDSILSTQNWRPYFNGNELLGIGGDVRELIMTKDWIRMCDRLILIKKLI